MGTEPAQRMPRLSASKSLSMLDTFFPKHSRLLLSAIRKGSLARLAGWHEMLLVKLIHATSVNAAALRRAYDDPELYSIAFRARNLLELTIWTQFCGKSESNAKRFFYDAFRDAIGMGEASRRGLPETLKAKFKGTLDKSDAEMARSLDSVGMKPGDRRYTKVADAADAIGRKGEFLATNTLLSKFAHPTAMMVVSMPNNKIQKVFRASMLFEGAILGAQSLTAIHSTLDKHGYPVHPTDIMADGLAHVSSIIKIGTLFRARRA